MKEKLRQHFLKIGPRRFVLMTVFSLLILDLLTGHSFRMSLIQNGFSEKLVQLSIKQANLQASDLSNETLSEVHNLMNMSLDFMLGLILVNNIFFYFFYFKKKLWAYSYVAFYTLTAGFLSLSMIFDKHISTGWLIFNIATIPMYLYLFLGVKLLKAETTLAPKKKGQ
jgi:hypothetical protein